MRNKPVRHKPQPAPSGNASSRKSPPADGRADLFNRYRLYLEFFAILLLVFVTYGNSINNDYNLDDGYIVSLDDANLQTSKGIRGIPEILTSNYSTGEGVTYGYRPLGKVTMAIEFSLWGNDPHKSHAVNLVLFAINCFLLLLFIRKVAGWLDYKTEPVIYLAVLFFILHPIHTEVVCSIKNREEILSFLFSLLALLAFGRYQQNPRWYHILFFATSLVLALLSKQTAFNTLGIMFLIISFQALKQYQDGDRRLADFFRALMTKQALTYMAVAVGVGYLILQRIPAKLPANEFGFSQERFEMNPFLYFPGSHVFPNCIQTVLFYCGKLVLPFPLLFYYGYDMIPDRGWDSIYPYLGIAILLGLVYAVYHSFRRRQSWFIVYWILFFAVAIFPFSNSGIFQFVTGIVGERLAYQASAAYCVVLAMGLYALVNQLQKWLPATSAKTDRYRLYAMVLLVALPYFFITRDRNTHWLNKETLFTHDIKYLGNSARANLMIAGNIMNQVNVPGYPEADRIAGILEAKGYLNRAVEVYPKYDAAWLGLGNLHSAYMQMNDSAVYFLSRIDTSRSENFSKVQEVLGDIYYYDSSDVHKSLEHYQLGLARYPQYKRLYQKITQIMFKQKMFDSLMTFGDLGIRNNWPEGYINKGDALINRKDTAAAVKYYQQAIDMGFYNPRLVRNLRYYYEIKGNKEMLKRLPQ